MAASGGDALAGKKGDLPPGSDDTVAITGERRGGGAADGGQGAGDRERSRLLRVMGLRWRGARALADAPRGRSIVRLPLFGVEAVRLRRQNKSKRILIRRSQSP
ncbi:hypothetical protein AKI39_12065 [Bordetella sp. H567]|nr:hypothetical protein AKI39_12065 [Bordetella sp. H567]